MNEEVSKQFIEEVKTLILDAQKRAIRFVNTERVILYWNIGKNIFEEQQKGKSRADYGSFLLKRLAEELTQDFGSGFSVRQLEMCRQFFLRFPIANALRSQLSWTQYRLLIRIEEDLKREFYIEEACANNWSARQLERQINSQLYERLVLSTDKENVLAVAKKEKNPLAPKDIIKDPMILEFLGVKPDSSLYEKDIEKALISNIQEFLLELGNGFSFVARQKRIQMEDDNFFIDLVFYNRLLKCFVLVELKNDKISHQDIGQLQMYVNYYDRVEKIEGENPTIGILLCTDKNDTMVKFALPENNQSILASEYKLYLPTEQQIMECIKEKS